MSIKDQRWAWDNVMSRLAADIGRSMGR
jgi:hypothetical protein